MSTSAWRHICYGSIKQDRPNCCEIFQELLFLLRYKIHAAQTERNEMHIHCFIWRHPWTYILHPVIIFFWFFFIVQSFLLFQIILCVLTALSFLPYFYTSSYEDKLLYLSPIVPVSLLSIFLLNFVSFSSATTPFYFSSNLSVVAILLIVFFM
jgi:hypothetical protein